MKLNELNKCEKRKLPSEHEDHDPKRQKNEEALVGC